MATRLKPHIAEKYSQQIGDLIADLLSRPELPRGGGPIDYREVFREPTLPMHARDSAHKPQKRRVGDSAFQTHIGSIYGPINPNLLPFSVEFIGYPALNLLRQNILIQNIITTYAEEMTKKWAVLSSPDGTLDEPGLDKIRAADKKWKGQSLFRKTLEEKGFTGGCLLFIDVGDDNLEAPLELTPDHIPMGSLRGFRLVEAMNCYAMGYNAYDPLAPNYFIPSYWNVQGKDIHASRFLYFAENELPMLLKPAYMFFGIPLPQMLLDYVYNFERSRDAAARAIRNHSLLGLMTDLSAILQTGICPANPQSIINRLKIMQATRDQDGIALLNKETEQFFQITTPLSGLMELVSQQLELLSLVTGQPVTKLFGTPPRGFNTTDEISEQNWAQKIAGMQRSQLADNVDKYFKIIQLSELGTFSESLEITFPDIREMTDKETAELNNMKAQGDATLVGAGIIDPSEARERLASDSESGYDSIYIADDEQFTPEERKETKPDSEMTNEKDANRYEEQITRDAEPGWKTINGTHVQMGEKGNIIKGPEKLKKAGSVNTREKTVSQQEKKNTHTILKSNYPALKKDSAAANALISYSGPAFLSINGLLRSPHREVALKNYPNLKNEIDEISNTIESTEPLKENITVFRGLRGDILTSLQPGTEFVDHGFSSTSANEDVAKKFASTSEGKQDGKVLVVNVPAGKKGAYLPGLLANDKAGNLTEAEQEFVLPMGSRFKISRIDGNKVYAEVI